jgi:hypothetical protein
LTFGVHARSTTEGDWQGLKRAIAQQIDAMLRAVQERGSENTLSASDVRHAVREYLANRADELQGSSWLIRRSHWDFVMADYNPTREGVVVLFAFGRDVLTLCCGRGPMMAVRRFCEMAVDVNARDAPRALRGQFPDYYDCTRFAHDEFRAWLGRSYRTRTPN